MAVERIDLSGKKALVTGASSGLGQQFALTLAEAGADVAITARREPRLQDLAGMIRKLGVNACPVAMDICDCASVEGAIDQVVEQLGGLDILVNNAGIAVQKPAEKMTIDDYVYVMDTNLRGAWHCAILAGQHMIATKKGGKIINISSLLAHKTIPQLSLYAMSKAALNQMTRSLALEWARHAINVNAIAPGYIETEMNSDYWKTPAGEKFMQKFPHKRVGTPRDLDGLLLLLASGQGRFISGAVINADDAQVFM